MDSNKGHLDELSFHCCSRHGRMANVNSGQIYQYINQQTTNTFRTHDQYRSWTLNKGHRQTVHNQILTPRTAHQSESKGRISMEFECTNDNEINNGYGTSRIIRK